jgi:uncharacterized membrane protein
MKLLRWILGIAAVAWFGQYLMALATPHLIMGLLHSRGSDTFGSNTLFIAPSPDHTMRTVVRPSPDLIYAICVYDLSGGPVRIESPVPTRYWSMQFYQMNTDNFAGITNQRDESNRIGRTARVTLVGPDADASAFAGEVIQSPTQRGVMLLRASAIGDASEQQAAINASRCEALRKTVS